MTTQIGATLGSMVTLESLGITEPETSYSPYSAIVSQGDGVPRGVGFGVGEWHWNYLTAAQKAMLKTYCDGQAKTVYIRTRKNDNTFANFDVVMIWTQADTLRSSRTLDFTIKLQRMVEI